MTNFPTHNYFQNMCVENRSRLRKLIRVIILELLELLKVL